MSKRIKKDILRSTSYERDAKSSYLILEIEGYSSILEYQTEMINNNLHYGILPIKSAFRDQKMILYYDITSKKSLEAYLSKAELNRNQLIRILTDIAKAILDSKELLLDFNSFVLDEEKIFISSSNLRPKLAYIPLKLEADINEEFKEFVKRLLSTWVRLEGSNSGLFVDRILSYTDKDDFKLSDFVKDLNHCIGNDTEKNSSKDASECKSEELSNNIIIKEMNSEESTDNHKQYIKKKIYKPINVLIAVVCQIAITILLLMAQDSINNINDDPITTYLGIVLVIIAFDILLFKKLFNKDSMVEKAIPKAKTKKSIKEKSLLPPAVDYAASGGATAILIPEKPNPTEELNSTSDTMVKAFLKDINNGKITNIQEIKPPFTIGRHIDHADYIINNKAIGRTHAQIIINENKYYIKDIGSKNGTKLNGMKLEANKDYELKNEDIIIFADSKHIFNINDKVDFTSQDINSPLNEVNNEC